MGETCSKGGENNKVNFAAAENAEIERQLESEK
jgi:hypothetical protein